MYHQHIPEYIRFQASEGSVTELISASELQGKMCDLHRIAVQTHHISDNYISAVTSIIVTTEENEQLVFLEKNLDFCVLKARRNKVAATVRDEPRQWDSPGADPQGPYVWGKIVAKGNF